MIRGQFELVLRARRRAQDALSGPGEDDGENTTEEEQLTSAEPRTSPIRCGTADFHVQSV